MAITARQQVKISVRGAGTWELPLPERNRLLLAQRLFIYSLEYRVLCIFYQLLF